MGYDVDVIVVGAGLAGLAAAREVHATGRSVLVLEASDGPGGRVRSDEVDGFILDRGFQVLLTAYPEAQRVLDYATLQLRHFEPGALVHLGGHLHRVGDPFRQPTSLPATSLAPVGSLADKLRVLALRRRVSKGEPAALFAKPDTTARQALLEAGFSPRMIDRFFRPLFAGITLDADLSGSSRQLEFVFRMLSAGDAAVPANGMGAIPQQLAAALPSGALRVDVPATAVTSTTVTVEGGELLSAGAVIVAVDQSAAAALDEGIDRGWNGVTTVWLAAPEPPTDATAILLDGDGTGPAVDVAVMSNVSPRYAPPDQALVVASAITLDTAVTDAIVAQLRDWFGSQVTRWEVLRTDRIPHAQPRLGLGYDPLPPTRRPSGVFVAGDQYQDPSINGALTSGRRAATDAMAALDRL